MNAELAKSAVVDADWKPRMQPMFMCPGGQVEPDPCDCGFVGEWDYRNVYIWCDTPGRPRGDWVIRRDMAKGFPHRPKDEGYWVIGGWDERCPGCGDLERISAETGEVVSVHLSRSGRLNRAEQLRERAQEVEASAWLAPDDVVLAEVRQLTNRERSARD